MQGARNRRKAEPGDPVARQQENCRKDTGDQHHLRAAGAAENDVEKQSDIGQSQKNPLPDLTAANQVINPGNQQHTAHINRMAEGIKDAEQAIFQKALTGQALVIGQGLHHILVADLEDILEERYTAGDEPDDQQHRVDPPDVALELGTIRPGNAGIKQRKFDAGPADLVQIVANSIRDSQNRGDDGQRADTIQQRHIRPAPQNAIGEQIHAHQSGTQNAQIGLHMPQGRLGEEGDDGGNQK